MIEVVTDLKSLRSLEDEWNRLAAASDSPLLQYDWFYHCAECICDESSLHIIVYREGTEAKAIAPFVLVSRANIPWLEIIGSAELYEPTGLLFDDLSSLRILSRAIVRQGFPINLQRIPTTSPIYNEARAACRGRGLLVRRQSAGSSYIPIASDWDSFYQSIGKNRRADFRKKKDRAKKFGEISVEIVCPDEDALEEMLGECFRIEAASWKSRNGTALRENPSLRHFFQRYAATAGRKGILRLFFYSVAGQAVAMHIGVEYKRRLWIYKLGYDESWSRISPGMQLTQETISFAFLHKLKGYEFLGSEETWQHTWPVSVHDYSSVIIYPFSRHGLRGIYDTGITFLRNRIGSLGKAGRPE
jgi:CelD/BcsL family acetyltransferase involved in cellulose biosynthesis